MKNWGGLILCFVLSAAIWLIFNVSQTYSQIVNIPVLVSSDIPGHSQSCSREITVAARCNAVGFDLIRLNRRTEAVPVFIDAVNLKQVEGDVFVLPTASVLKYSEQIFGVNVKVESLLSEDLLLTFPAENFKKVPVILNTRLLYHKQYMSPKPATTSPDSILVYGTPDKIKDINEVGTEVVRAVDLRKSVHGNVKLNVPGGLRTSVTEVEYNIPVSRYVDISATREIKTANVPDGVDLLVLPGKAEIRMKCYFPVDKNPMEDVRLYIDYRDYESSLNGKCRIKAEGVSRYVISLEIEPEFCSCIQNVQ